MALSVETSNCSVIFSNFFSTKHNKDNDKIEWMEQELAGEKEDQTECFTCEFTADDADNVALRTPQISQQMFWNKNWQERRRIKQNASHVSLQQMMWIMLLCKVHKNQNTCL